MRNNLPKRNRRPLNFRSQYQPQLASVTLDDYDVIANTVTLALGQAAGFFLTGVPLAFAVLNGGVARTVSSVVIQTDGSGNQTLVLTLNELLVGSLQIDLPAYSPGARNGAGGYLAPANVVSTLV